MYDILYIVNSQNVELVGFTCSVPNLKPIRCRCHARINHNSSYWMSFSDLRRLIQDSEAWPVSSVSKGLPSPVAGVGDGRELKYSECGARYLSYVLL